jgi:hypothetical protein
MSVKVIDYFKARKQLTIAIGFIICLGVLDIGTTAIALNLTSAGFIESNPIAAGWMAKGTVTWFLNYFATILFLTGCAVAYWRYLEVRHPNHLQYYLFVVSLGVSALTAAVINNIRLLVLWLIVR